MLAGHHPRRLRSRERPGEGGRTAHRGARSARDPDDGAQLRRASAKVRAHDGVLESDVIRMQQRRGVVRVPDAARRLQQADVKGFAALRGRDLETLREDGGEVGHAEAVLEGLPVPEVAGERERGERLGEADALHARSIGGPRGDGWDEHPMRRHSVATHRRTPAAAHEERAAEETPMAEIRLRDTKLFYTERGAGEAVVFVHGGLSDYRAWEAQLDPIGARYRAVSYSRRYAWPNQPIADGADDQMGPHVDDLAAFLRALDLAPAHLVGNSWGAFIALLLARRQPELVRTLLLEEPPVLPLWVSAQPRPAELVALLAGRPRAFIAFMTTFATGVGPAAKAFRRGDMETGLRLFATAVEGREAFARLSEARRGQMRANVKTLAASLLGAGFPPFSQADARRVHAPVLLLNGADSPAFNQRLSDGLAEVLPNVERVRIPRASHHMHEEEPRAVNDAILGFLAKHATAAEEFVPRRLEAAPSTLR